jgi:hypothetical protein
MSAVLSTPNVSRLPDADMQAVPAALARAAQSARELAARTGTPLVVARDGKLIEAPIAPTDGSPKDNRRAIL